MPVRFESNLEASQETSPTGATSPPPQPAIAPPRNETLNEARAQLENLRQNLENLKAHQNNQWQLGTVNYPAQISATKNQIQELSEILQDYRWIENSINRAAGNALRQQNSEAQIAREQIDQVIRTLEQEIRRNHEILLSWQSVLGLPTEQEAQLNEVRNQMQLQIDQLNVLRANRIALSERIINRSRAVRRQADQEQALLQEDGDILRDQIQTLREEALRLDQARQQIRMSSNSLTEQIRQAEQDLTQQHNRVRALESTLEPGPQ